MRTTFVLAWMCTVLSLMALNMADADQWQPKADMPTPRRWLVTAVVGGKIYAIGGAPTGGNPTAIVEEYDPVLDSWTRKASMSTPRRSPAIGVVDGKIYVMGGWNGSSVVASVEQYDPATDTWVAKANMLQNWRGPSTAVVDGKIYVIGNWAGATNRVDEYDPATDTWTQKANMPTGRYASATAVIDGRIYAIGGVIFRNSQEITVNAVEVYDPATDTWTQKADMPIDQAAIFPVMVNGGVYLFGGWTGVLNVSTILATVVVYDPATGRWIQKTDMPTRRANNSAAIVNGKIYVVGGVSAGSFTPLSTVEEYTPDDFLHEDVVSPARITDLAVADAPTPDGISFVSARLEWTAPGDDGTQGQANRYDIRYSRDPIEEAEYLPYPKLPEIPSPVRGGQKQSIELDWLEPGPYYFAIVTFDDVYNRSPLSNVLKMEVPPIHLFSDATDVFDFGGRASLRASMALCLDIDGNGLTDLYLADEDVYLNLGNRTFGVLRKWELDDRGAEVAAVANYDNSGGPDILFVADDGLQLYQHTDSAYLNVTEQAGLPPDIEPEWMTFADINGDNWLDLYMSVRGEFSRVYLNNRDGTFTEKAQELGLKFRDTQPVIFSDLNGDNRVDAYVCGDRIYFQQVDGEFLVDPDVSIRPDPDITDACVGDYDNDGDMDVYVCRDSEQPNSLYRNTGSGQFDEVTQQTGVGDEGDGVSANFVDFNNDGRLDLYVLNKYAPSVLYIQQPDGTFEAHRDPEALDLQRPNSAAFGDFDGDGDVDIYVTDTLDRGRMYRNNHEGNHWLQVKLVGSLSNRDALGARVYVSTPDGTQMREVRSQNGWCSDSLPVEFGLGTHAIAPTVDIRWPSGQWQSLHQVSADRILTVEEGGLRWETTWGDIRRTALLQNFPNPFNPETWIPFTLAAASEVSLTIYDSRGQLVRHLELGTQQAGTYTSRAGAIYWDGRNESGERVASGVYFYQLMAKDFSATRKMVMVK